MLQRRTLAGEKVTEIAMRSASGAPVRSFGTNGHVAVEGGSTLMTMSDGDILAAVDKCNGKRSSVEMLDQSGSRVTSFGKDGCGAAIGFESEWIDVDDDGRILLAGSISYCEPCAKGIAPSFETALARLLPDGRLRRSRGGPHP